MCTLPLSDVDRGNGVFDTEDLDGNGLLDPGEDLNGNGVFDQDNTDPTNRDVVWKFGTFGDMPVTGEVCSIVATRVCEVTYFA